MLICSHLAYESMKRNQMNRPKPKQPRRDSDQYSTRGCVSFKYDGHDIKTSKGRKRAKLKSKGNWHGTQKAEEPPGCHRENDTAIRIQNPNPTQGQTRPLPLPGACPLLHSGD